MVGVSEKKADDVVERRVTRYIYNVHIVYFPEIKLLIQKYNFLWLRQSAKNTKKCLVAALWELWALFTKVGGQSFPELSS